MNNLFNRFTTQEKIIFAKRLSMLINSGVPVLSSLKMLQKQAVSKKSILIFSSLMRSVEQGKSLSKSMENFKKDFGVFSISIIQVGELSGQLQQSLSYMSEELKKQQELKRKIISALIYPAFIAFATMCMVILLITYVFPKILPVFKSLRVPLPWTTKSLIFISDLLINHGLIIITIIITIISLAIFISKKAPVKLWLDRNILKVLFIGPLLQAYCIANFTRTLGLLLESDVKINKAINILILTIDNSAYQSQFKILNADISHGKGLFVNFQKQPNLFPPLLCQMVEVGEATGSLSKTLNYISEIYEEELNNLTKDLSTSIEPMLMIIMGLLVGFIAISIITPIYGITQNLHP